MSLTTPATAQWAIPRHVIDTTYMDGWLAPLAAYAGSNTWAVQYRAIYVPIRVRSRVVVKKIGYGNSTVGTGNVDVGLYDAGGTKILSTTSQTKGTTQALVTYDVTDTTIGPGQYYLALNNDTTTDTFSAYSAAVPGLAALGVLTETLGAVTLPGTATWAVDNTLTIIPVICLVLVTEV